MKRPSQLVPYEVSITRIESRSLPFDFLDATLSLLSLLPMTEKSLLKIGICATSWGDFSSRGYWAVLAVRF
jgi:hypothetical protein